jgi:EmrB/QacA subfamily drug resistance transporter
MSVETQTRAVIESPPADERPSWGALLVVLAGAFITVLDFFIVNVAIPSMQAELHAGPAAVQFVVAGFGVAVASCLITGGRLGDLYGRRKMFGIGVAVFTIASAMCGFAPSAGVLIAARVLQGFAAALLTPQVLAILNTVYTGPYRARAFNAYGLVIGLAAVFGQLIGGALISADIAGSGWRSIFLINLPFGVVTLILLPRLVPESRESARSRLDLVGAGLVTAGLVAIVLPVVEGQQQGWPLWTWLCLVAAVPLLVAFVLYQRQLARRGGSPVIDLSLFAERVFSIGMISLLVYFAALASFFLVLALYLQQGRGLSALDSGLIFGLIGIGFFVASGLVPRVTARLGRQIVAVGAVAVAAGFGAVAGVVFSIGVGGELAWLAPGLAVAGFGMGFVAAPLPSIVLAGVAPRHAAAASGVLSTAQQGGGAVGVAVIGVVFYNVLGSRVTPASFGHAFAVSLVVLVAMTAAVAALVQFMPRARKAE